IPSNAPFARREVASSFRLALLAAGFRFGGGHGTGDMLFAICIAFFIFTIGRRFVRRQDSPPPSFVLVALGLLNGFFGAVLVALSENAVYSVTYRIGAALLEQGFVLLPILGVAPFFMRRLLGMPLPDDPAESPRLPAGW